MQLEFLTNSSVQTKKAGAALARVIIKADFAEKAVLVALVGDLGGGKTTFTQGLAAGLGIKARVLSPTFVILKSFALNKRFLPFKRLYHIDCYRIEKAKDLADLGFKGIINEPSNIVVVEWADKVKKLLPKNALFVNFDFINTKNRKIRIKWLIRQ